MHSRWRCVWRMVWSDLLYFCLDGDEMTEAITRAFFDTLAQSAEYEPSDESVGIMSDGWHASSRDLDEALSAAMKVADSHAWAPMHTAPKDRPIMLWGEVDGGNRGAAACAVSASWSNDHGIFGEDGGWLVSFTDDCVASVENPTHWRELPTAPPCSGCSAVSGELHNIECRVAGHYVRKYDGEG